MIFLFTRSNKVGSRLIQWGLDTDVSHMAVLFGKELRPSSVIIESRMESGVKPEFLKHFLDRNEVVSAIKPDEPTNWKFELEVRDAMCEELVGKEYDHAGVSYLALASLWYRKILRRPQIPGRNIWADDQDFFCSEVLVFFRAYLENLGVSFQGIDPAMVTPPKARDMLIAAPKMTHFNFFGDFEWQK